MNRLLLIILTILLCVLTKYQILCMIFTDEYPYRIHIPEKGTPTICSGVPVFSSVFESITKLSEIFERVDSLNIRNCFEPPNNTVISIFNERRIWERKTLIDMPGQGELRLHYLDNSMYENSTKFQKQFFFRAFSIQKNLKSLSIYHNNLKFSMLLNILQLNQYIENLYIYSTIRENFTLPVTFFDNSLQLQKIHIKNSGFNNIPENLFDNLSMLSNLYLEKNNIKSLPDVLCQFCSELISLFLNDNQITQLSINVFKNLTNLQILDLSDNQIHFIPCGIFDDLESLNVFSMEGNNLQTLSGCHVGHLDNLRVAYFSFNNLTLQDEITKTHSLLSPFRNCPSIQILRVASNQISTIFDDWLELAHISHLNVSNNNIEYLKEIDFQFESERELKLDVSHNEIKTMTIFDYTKKLNYSLENTKFEDSKKKGVLTIIANNNPIICDCDLYSILLTLERNLSLMGDREFVIQIGAMRCAEPKWLNNTPIATLKSATLECLVEGKNTVNATCPDTCKCWRRPSDSMYIVDCSSRGLIVAPKIIIPPAKHQVQLNLSNNSLSSMPLISQPGYDSVIILDLSHNNIELLPQEALSMNLKTLYMHNNKLLTIGTQVLNYLENSKKFTELTIYDNLWKCNCQTFHLICLIIKIKSKSIQFREIFCKEETLRLQDIREEEVCPTISRWIVGICVGVSSSAIISCISVMLYYRHRKKIKVWLYAKQWCLWWVTEDGLDKDKIYDAFISFSHKDNDFVMKELVAELESGTQPFKLCVHYRDWPAGEYISKQVVHSVENSRRTIVVLSENFLESVWGKIEFRTAHCQALNDGRIRVIMIIFGDIPAVESLDIELQSYLSMNTYVKWGDPWFWKKLRYALPHRSKNTASNIDVA